MAPTTTTVPWAVQEIPVPASLDSDDAWALHAEAELQRVVQRAAWGHTDLAYPAPQTLEVLRDQRYTARIELMVTDPDRPREAIGAAFMRIPQAGNTHLVDADLQVHPDHRGRGIATALLGEVEARTRALGRRLLILASDHHP
jgi:GNAT superfamily N-acetyltransferase